MYSVMLTLLLYQDMFLGCQTPVFSYPSLVILWGVQNCHVGILISKIAENFSIFMFDHFDECHLPIVQVYLQQTWQ